MEGFCSLINGRARYIYIEYRLYCLYAPISTYQLIIHKGPLGRRYERRATTTTTTTTLSRHRIERRKRRRWTVTRSDSSSSVPDSMLPGTEVQQ